MECAAKGLAAEPCAGGVAERRCGSCGAVAYCSRAHQHQTGGLPVAAMECAAKGLAAEPCAGGVAERRCGSCGAVAYCSRAHQIIHWRVHKDECDRFAEQMRRMDMLSQFPFTFLEPPALVPLFTPLLQLRFFIWHCYFSSVENCEFPSTRCFFLQKIKLHQKGLWKSECICGSDVASVNDLSIAAEWNLQSSLCPCTEPESPVPAVLASWKDYYQWRSLPLHSPVAVLLHWPLTLYHCLQLARFQTSRYNGQDTLCIHYLGNSISSFVLEDSNPHIIVAPNAGVAAYPSWMPTIFYG
nr:unnamed protein product [Digitaria exilis]